MIKLLHTGDLHLGVETYGRTGPDGINTRITDYLLMLDEMVAWSVENKIDAFVIAGDVFDVERPANYVVSEFSKRIRKLLDNQIAVIITPGNHETTSSARVPSVLETIKALKPSNTNEGLNISCHVLGSQPKSPGDMESCGDLTQVETRSGILQVLAMPYPRRSELLTGDELKNKSTQEKKDFAATRFLERISALAKRSKQGLPSIFIGHFGLKEAHMQPGRKGYLADDVVLSLYDLSSSLSDSPALYSYIALGHYHNPQMPTTNLSPSIESENLDGEVDSRLDIIPCVAWGRDYLEFVNQPEDSVLPLGKKPVKLIKTVYSGSPGRKDFSDGSRQRNFIKVEVDENASWGEPVSVKKSRQLRQLTLENQSIWKTELEEKFFKSHYWHDIYSAGKESGSVEETEQKVGLPLPIFRLKIRESARNLWTEIRAWLESLNMFHRILLYVTPEKRNTPEQVIAVAEAPLDAVSGYIEALDDEFSRTHKKELIEQAQKILTEAEVI
ncbi:MAG TPA: metallophosphoesterase [Caldisericia bacterium]|nr:metallophosphoesterase [Caldisericia bacterium]HPF48493.1 metallophosphoesterase [Caldisericia bacterium]HPI83327.1 metallophosphoesterase [Caldisericia bacterium]HPQ92947.1 metallophosphoesterase [Caldisericia bacterium]HRV73955.1 metallophosphoesterase [Caldisericia bacterium]